MNPWSTATTIADARRADLAREAEHERLARAAAAVQSAQRSAQAAARAQERAQPLTLAQAR